MVQYLKKIFRTEKIRKKIMASFIVVIVLMSVGTDIGGNDIVLYGKAV